MIEEGEIVDIKFPLSEDVGILSRILNMVPENNIIDHIPTKEDDIRTIVKYFSYTFSRKFSEERFFQVYVLNRYIKKLSKEFNKCDVVLAPGETMISKSHLDIVHVPVIQFPISDLGQPGIMRNTEIPDKLDYYTKYVLEGMNLNGKVVGTSIELISRSLLRLYPNIEKIEIIYWPWYSDTRNNLSNIFPQSENTGIRIIRRFSMLEDTRIPESIYEENLLRANVVVLTICYVYLHLTPKDLVFKIPDIDHSAGYKVIIYNPFTDLIEIGYTTIHDNINNINVLIEDKLLLIPILCIVELLRSYNRSDE